MLSEDSKKWLEDEKIKTKFNKWKYKITNIGIETAKAIQRKTGVVVIPILNSDHWYYWYVVNDTGRRIYLSRELTTLKLRQEKVRIKATIINGDLWLMPSDNQLKFNF